MTDLIERLQRWHATGDYAYPAEESDEGEFVDYDAHVRIVERLAAERDELRRRIEDAVKVENFRRYTCGHEYMELSGTDETEVTDGNLYGKRVALVVLP